jgi:hypothetical protein
MTITALPAAPSRSDPANFSDEADALLGALATFVTEANATAVAMNLNDTTATSTTSLAISAASKALTVDISKSYQPGMSVKIARTASPSNWMHGDVTSYNAGTGALVVNVTNILGSGTYTDWTVTFSAPIDPESHDAVTVSEPLVLSTQALSFRGTAKYISSYADLATAVSTIGATESHLIIDADCTVAADVTIPSTLAIEVQKGSVITVNDAKTLTINGPLLAGPYQIFNCVDSGAALVTWSAAGWNEDASTWTFGGGVLTHVTGNTTAVTATLTAAIVAGVTYKVTITGTGGGAMAAWTLGGVSGTAIPSTGAISIVEYITATTTGSFIITPASTCTAAFSSITISSVGYVAFGTGSIVIRYPIWFGTAGGVTIPVVRDSGQGSVLNATFGTEAAPLASLDIPIVINHYTDNASPNPVSVPIYITTNCPNSDGGTGFLLNNIGGADGMTLAVGSAKQAWQIDNNTKQGDRRVDRDPQGTKWK